MSKPTELHPVQSPVRRSNTGMKIRREVTERAYEVYCELYGSQEAIMDLQGRNCRGGFGLSELVGFLYARSFPRTEWRERVREAWEGMENF